MPDPLSAARCLVAGLVGEQAGGWDVAGVLPKDVLAKLGAAGVLCAELPTCYGGCGVDSRSNGELTAYVGSLCGSVRSVMTSQGMAAWTIQRLGGREQRAEWLPKLAGGELAAVAFSEPGAGSDLSAMATTIEADGDAVLVTGEKAWVTAARYADVLVVFGRYGNDAGAVVIPASTPGVRVEPVPDPVGCRAAGHARLRFDGVRVPIAHLLGRGGQSLSLLATTALAYGRMSVAWGCVGILRACLAEVTAHARTRIQFGKPLADHQLVARHLAELYTAEQIAARACEHASRCWDEGSPEVFTATVLAKQIGATHAARGAASALQVLASAGARDGHPVARAYRDAKLMEIIEGTTEICQVILAQHALTAT